MRKTSVAGAAALAVLAIGPVHEPIAQQFASQEASAPADPGNSVAGRTAGTDRSVHGFVRERLDRDLDALRTYRPGYPFWQHVFMIDNGQIAFGSAADGRLVATFPIRDGWIQQARWEETSLASLLTDQTLRGNLAQRREHTARLLEPRVGPVVHHATTGSFLAPGAERYGSFLGEWGAIFERFGIPAEIGLAQAIVESGLRGRIRSEAGALGFCQWMPQNWERLKRLSEHVIEGYNQTTQVPYCAAYLSVLATKYGSYIPALSEHHAGGVNVGRTIVNGAFVGGDSVHARYFLGAELVLQLRELDSPTYREVVGSYGPRSFRYVEMVFGNTFNSVALQTTMPQQQIFAMRAARSIPLEEVTRRTGLSTDEVRRFNPALVRQVPAGANLYLPLPVDDFGPDASFWHRAPTAEYAGVLGDFLRLEQRYAPEDWDDQSVVEELRAFQRRFRATATEEGTVMAAVIAYVVEEISRGRRMQILSDFRNSERVSRLLERGVLERDAIVPIADGTGGRPRQHTSQTPGHR